ncbi:LytR C-terminal domain-containing protein [Actinoplanes teichomyceticus]|uniref:LytR cell envelope-related transcriptional attenuator n=1 Tax=Actinoplanes teichomyceticus TaxID=1867 RepID=A0A561VMH1_ACTTI|nr:LytR C-terminal domain-containing protein [Actinoplanes teichomyceticus]TWG12816.1 LytR cell envelope-related transcriptional attenuator [Actinoplanes teichomyceticus]GIF13561.1 hypothetical protein Ate01nite_35930 [Actinoplanes teichomyceticus]
MTHTRVRAYLVIGVLAAVAAVVAVLSVVRDSQAGAAAGGRCPAGAVPADLTFPDVPEQVTLRVLDGTRAGGVARRVSADFRGRGFRVQPASRSRTRFDQVAIIQYGPKTVGAAQWIRAFFLGQATMEFNAKRGTEAIDVVIGDRFRQLATFTEVNQSLAQLSEPTLPPGTCAAPAS